jgi:hypothetical protein
MEQLNSLLNNKGQLILSILFVIYLVIGLKMPPEIATVFDTMGGKIIIALVALSLFVNANPIVGILGIFVAYQLIKTSADTTGRSSMEQFYPVDRKKWGSFTPTNQFPYTLEQEVVKNMTTQKFNTSYVKAPFRPSLDDTHDAAPLSSQT